MSSNKILIKIFVLSHMELSHVKFGNLLRYQSAEAGGLKVRHNISYMYIVIGAVLSAENAKTYLKQ